MKLPPGHRSEHAQNVGIDRQLKSFSHLPPWRDPRLSAARSVELVFLDDQSNPHNVPALYTKMIDVDKVYLLARTKHRVMYEATPRADGQRVARNGHDNVLAYL